MKWKTVFCCKLVLNFYNLSIYWLLFSADRGMSICHLTLLIPHAGSCLCRTLPGFFRLLSLLLTLLIIFFLMTKDDSQTTDIRLVHTLQRCFLAFLLTDKQQTENLWLWCDLRSVLTLLILLSRWAPDCRMKMGLREPWAAMCDGSGYCDLQTSSGHGELVGCGHLEVGCLAGQHFNRHLQLSCHIISFPLFWFSGNYFRGERGNGKEVGKWEWQRSETVDVGKGKRDVTKRGWIV